MEPTIERNYDLDEHKRIVCSDVEGVSGEMLQKQEIEFKAHEALSLPGCHIEKDGISQDLIGVMMVDDNAVGIIRLIRNNEEKIALSKLSVDGNSINYLELLKRGIPKIIGRENLDKENMAVSRKHVMITLSPNNVLKIEDIGTNGTTFLSYEQDRVNKDEEIAYRGLKKFFKPKVAKPVNKIGISQFISSAENWALSSFIPGLIFEPMTESAAGDAIFDYTNYASQNEKKVSRETKFEEPDAEFATGEAIDYMRDYIARDTPINGGVYIVPGIQEAIVVDDGTKPKRGGEPTNISRAYDSAFFAFLQEAKSNKVDVLHGIKPDQIISTIRSAYESAVQIIKYDSKIAEFAERVFRDKKVNLEDFIKEGKGVCRHQALLVGYILERIIKGGYMDGSVSVDRNRIPGKGGHAWARYVANDGTVYIIDPAQHYVGTLKDSLKTVGAWSYSRPEDRF